MLCEKSQLNNFFFLLKKGKKKSGRNIEEKIYLFDKHKKIGKC